jgi:hypothetical protein
MWQYLKERIKKLKIQNEDMKRVNTPSDQNKEWSLAL